jgi:phosphate transport system permease protein
MATEASIRVNRADKLFAGVSGLCAILVIVIMAGFFLQLTRRAMPAIEALGFDYIFNREGIVTEDGDYIFGAFHSIYGTLATTCIALVIAVPLSLAVALFLSELAPAWLARVVGTGVELLAAVPSIIYGMWGAFVFAPLMSRKVQPFLADVFAPVPGLNKLFAPQTYGGGLTILTAGIVLSFMILPFMSAVMRDVFKMTPSVMKESAYGMGATTWEVARKVIVPYGLTGLMGAVFLGLGRAIGETMAVAYVIGSAQQTPVSVHEPGTTIAATLANNFNEATGLKLSALIELGLILFVVTFLIQVAAHVWLRRIAAKMGEK